MRSIVRIIMIDNEKASPKWNNREEIEESGYYWGLLQSKQGGKKCLRKQPVPVRLDFAFRIFVLFEKMDYCTYESKIFKIKY